MEKHYRLLTLFLVLNITFQLISDATAGKIIDLLGYPVSITVLYFPIVYIISDIVTEVYGYAQARKILWLTLLSSVTAGVFYQLAVAIPSASFFESGPAYETVFGIVPRVLIGGWLAVFVGDIINNYILAKLKIKTGGKYLWFRTVSSTVFGQFGNTTIFYVVALGGVLPTNVLIVSILAGWIFKVAVEVILTPVTYAVVKKVKKIEGEDYYDRDTDFNPLKFGVR